MKFTVSKSRNPLYKRLWGHFILFVRTTFAWFTSSDEVTNRLTASADYDVKIVESFAPPANWLPNQESNKDVYNVNTGSIGAFVKDTVTSKITITREKTFDPTNSLDSAGVAAEITAKENALKATKQKLTKLTAAERYSVEAGSYLAFAPAGVTLGEKIVSMTPDANDLDGYQTTNNVTANPIVVTDFTPTDNGLYVFRRTIAVGSNAGEVTYRDEDFTYEAYYYSNGEYYKVKLTSITPDGEMDLADDGSRKDGQLTGADGVLFYDETTVETPVLTYDAGAHELVATVAGKYPAVDDTFMTALDGLADTYDSAIHAYEVALADYLRAYVASEGADSQATADLATLNAAKIAEAIALRDLLAEEAHLEALKTSYTAKKAALATAETNATTAGTDYSTAQSNTATALAVKTASLEDDAAFKAELTAAGYTGTTEEMVVGMSDSQWTTFKGSLSEKHDLYANTVAYYDALRAEKAALATKTAADNLVTTLTQNVNDLKAAIVTSITTLYGATAATAFSNSGNVTNIPTTGSSRPTEGGLSKAYEDAKTATTNAQSAYNTSSSTSGTASAALTSAYNAAVAAKTALDQARMAYEQKVEVMKESGDIIIHIKLANDVTTGGEANKWQIVPAATVDTDSDTYTDTAYFYYTSILGGGETTAKLIDYVKLDNSVTQDMYKSFDFDLDVKLASAQITYANVVRTKVLK